MAEVEDLTQFLRYVKENIYDVRKTQFKGLYNEEMERITLKYASLKTEISIPDNLYQAPLNIIKRANELRLKGITFIGRDFGGRFNRTVTIDFKLVNTFLTSMSKKRNLTEAGIQTFPAENYKEC